MTRKGFLSVVGAAIGGVLLGRKIPFGPFISQSGSGTSHDPFTDKLAHGPLDPVNSNRLWCRQQTAHAMQCAFPGISTCGRCGFPWVIIVGKDVEYADGQFGFAICRDCWDELRTAEYREPYYRALLGIWHEDWIGYKDKYPDTKDPLLYWDRMKSNIAAMSES